MFVCAVDTAKVLEKPAGCQEKNTYAWLRKRMPKRLITLAPMAMAVERLSVHDLLWVLERLMENVQYSKVEDLAKSSNQ